MSRSTHHSIRMMRVARCRAFAGQVGAILAANRQIRAGARWLTSEGETW